MIDHQGFRANVGIILSNRCDRVFWGKRVGQTAWQFPQGGIQKNESYTEAMFRELYEETGLSSQDVEVIGSTEDWLRYRIPRRFIRWKTRPLCIGQKQRWFILRLKCGDDQICLNRNTTPEFEDWKWVDYWYAPQHVVDFKRKVYCKALVELGPLLSSENRHPPKWITQYL